MKSLRAAVHLGEDDAHKPQVRQLPDDLSRELLSLD